MDPITAIFLASLIISTVLSVDGAVGMSLSNNRSSTLTQKANKLAEDITKDQALMDALQEAYNKRDTMLMNQLINSSPFGTRYYNLRKDYKSNAAKQAELAAARKTANEESAKVQGQISDKQSKIQTSGSIIADLISGSATTDPTSGIDDYKGSGYTEDQLKEVNYGQK